MPLIEGVVDVFLDRRLTRDDGRGLGQGVMDNREIISTFELLFEPRHHVYKLIFSKKTKKFFFSLDR